MILSARVLAGLLVLASVLMSGDADAQIVALGNSNTEGVGVRPYEAYPARLTALLHATGYAAWVVNAGVSGETTSDMLARLPAATPAGTQIVIVQGGYNDRKSGTPPAAIIANIEAILARLGARGIRGVVCGFFDPGWDAVGAAVAARHRAVFVPGDTCYDATHRALDGLHMNAVGHQVVALRLLPVVQRLLALAERHPGARFLRLRLSRQGAPPRDR